MIYDLLIKKSAPLELREDPSQGIQVAGLTRVHVKTAEHIMAIQNNHFSISERSVLESFEGRQSKKENREHASE